ncbi:ABC transporter permease subunit [Heyndrickxia sp. NPDC080065]|uniref:ABC transporter permease subunit n=1 Tax=Heyndrickxia sp. NPDC080065 TaxID=3390568 RepID=UPI003D066FF5
MGVYIAKRIVAIVPIFLLATLLTFGMIKLSPVDPAEAYFAASNTHPTEEALQQKREEFGLNKPLLIQYVNAVSNIVQLNFGQSYMTNKPVLDEVKVRLPTTIQLAICSILLTIIVSIPIGFISGIRKNGLIDHISRLFSFIGASIPSFWFGYLLMLFFSVKLDLFPVQGTGTWLHLVLPSITLALPFTVQYSRMLRSNVLENIEQPPILYAKMRGIHDLIIMLKYVLRMAIGPVITGLGMNLGMLLTGTIIVEVVFSLPGFGRYFIDAIFNRDMPVIQCYVLLSAVIYLLCNLVVDIIQMFVDPRIVKKGELL